MKVYIVLAWVWDDDTVVKCFDSLEKAEEFILSCRVIIPKRGTDRYCVGVQFYDIMSVQVMEVE